MLDDLAYQLVACNRVLDVSRQQSVHELPDLYGRTRAKIRVIERSYFRIKSNAVVYKAKDAGCQCMNSVRHKVSDLASFSCLHGH